MKKMIALLSAIAACLVIAGSVSAEKPKKNSAKKNKEKVLQVDRVALSIIKTNPPQLKIQADGKTRSAGWSDPELVAHVYIVPPADGIYEYDFVAKPPAGVSAQVITPITAHAVRQDIPKEMKGVRVIAAKNKKEATLKQPPAQKKQ